MKLGTLDLCANMLRKNYGTDFRNLILKFLLNFLNFTFGLISKARGYIAYYILFLKDTYVPYCILACVNKNRIHCNYNTEFN